MSAQDQAGGGSGSGDSVTAKVSGGVMLALVFVLFLIIVFVFFFYLYARRRMGRSTRFIFAAEHVAPHPGRGLDAALLRSLPVTVYRAADHKEGIECAVCLTELAEGDEARLLPKCSHGFHLACIDMWFRSHTTCPLCRAPVSATSSDGAEEGAAAAPDAEGASESPALPSGVLFWGTENQVNSGNPRQGPFSHEGSSGSKKPAGGGSGALVIEIPSGATTEGAASPLPPSKPALEEAKSPAPSSKFKSLTRLLSLGKRAAGPSQSPRGADIEQGHGASTPTPRAPSDP